MSNTAQVPGNPLIRKHGLRDSRALDGIDAARPAPNNAFMFSRPMPGGVALTPMARARSAATTHPFKASPRVRGGVILLHPGTVNGKTASAGYELAISDTGVVEVFVRVEPVFSDYEDYITGASFDTFDLLANTTLPSDTASTFHRPVARYEDGVKVAQYVTQSLEVYWCGSVDQPNPRWGVSG